MSAEYEITYSVRRRLPGEDDFTEVGFGASGVWASTDEAVHMVNSDVQNGCWETGPDMPDPVEISRKH